MSLHISSVPDVDDDGSGAGSSESGGTVDETWEDWEEDPTPCYSLFDDIQLPSASLALEHDQNSHGFDLNAASSKLGLDFHGRARLINYIRKNKVSAKELLNLSGSEAFLSDDGYLKPVIEDDPLILMESIDWSDGDEEKEIGAHAISVLNTSASRVAELEQELLAANTQLSQLRSLAKELVGVPAVTSSSKVPTLSELVGGKQERDDDSHYFESYGYQEIHAIMIQDSVRTSSYAKFLLSNPQLFRDKLVMDVGCGTGILSMFAARAGAKHVFAIDASDIALKARQNVKDNNFEDVITVIQGKVEHISLPPPYDHPSIKMDVIISEWMGYALLYESMLDSVLVARDRWLRPPTEDGTGGGVMAPSQCRMVLSLAETPDLVKEKITFWEDVYGFKMTCMAQDAYNETLIEHIKPEAVISNLFVVKDLPIQRITPRQLDFSQSFSLIATRDGVVHSFVLYFDTWFVPDGSDVPPDAAPTIVEVEGNFVTAEVVRVGAGAGVNAQDKYKGQGPSRKASMMAEKEKEAKPVEVSFSTGPASLCTHWKQTVFMVRAPFKVIEGSKVTGAFYCRKSETNSRELDVEIHYAVSHVGFGVQARDMTVQMFKVR